MISSTGSQGTTCLVLNFQNLECLQTLYQVEDHKNKMLTEHVLSKSRMCELPPSRLFTGMQSTLTMVLLLKCLSSNINL